MDTLATKSPLLSFVIPLYNVEEYIPRCLKSCMNQKEAVLGLDYEIILIDDGSPDNSMAIAKNITKGLPGCKYITQNNKGLGGARNTGIRHASGKYVWCIDSDDWIKDNAVSVLINALEKYSYPDIIVFRSANVKEDQLIVRQHEYINDKICSGQEAFINGELQTCVPFHIINRAILSENELQFREGIFHEDNEFMPRLAYYAKTVAHINDVLYFVFQNPYSITRSINPKKSYDLITVCESLSTFEHTHALSREMSKKLSEFISLSLNNALNGIFSQDDLIKNNFNKELHLHDDLFVHLRRSRIPKYIIERVCFYISNNYTAVYNMLYKLKRKR